MKEAALGECLMTRARFAIRVVEKRDSQGAGLARSCASMPVLNTLILMIDLLSFYKLHEDLEIQGPC